VAPVISEAESRTTAPLGTGVAVTGKVTPLHRGQLVYLQRYYNNAWHLIAKTALSSTSQYRFVVHPRWRGTYRYRVYKPADVDHVSNQGRTLNLKVT